MITHPVRDTIAESLAKAGLDSTTVLHLLDNLHQEVRDNDAKLHYPQGRAYLVSVLMPMRGGIRLSSIEATVTEAVKQIAEDVGAANAQLDLASEFRIPCTNKTGGYAEIIVERGEGDFSALWAVTDAAAINRSVWTDGGWRNIYRTGFTGAYRLSREDAIALGRQVAEIESRAIEERVAALDAEEARAAQELKERRRG